ncbi:MAG: flagellar biosynthesis anti-sigma factor FlgM [Methylococcales bacterium]|nr:flagellar biosynthesis anti-sigma factor FlgM [Methylococcales bacterium]
MNIQPLTDKSHATNLSQKSEATNNANHPEIPVSKDNVAFTTIAKEITKTFDSTGLARSIDTDRVSSIKQALADGEYPINIEKIAAKMTQIEQKQFSNT